MMLNIVYVRVCVCISTLHSVKCLSLSHTYTLNELFVLLRSAESSLHISDISCFLSRWLEHTSYQAVAFFLTLQGLFLSKSLQF